MSERPSFLAELKRRNVLRAAALYAAGAWLVVQVVTQVSPYFEVPAWVVRWVIVAAVIGFPFAMVLSWFYELTPEGIKRDADIEPEASIAPQTGKRLNRAIVVVLSLVIVLLLANYLVPHRDEETRAAVVPPTATKSIAVLPLVNRGGNKDEQYFSDGLSEDLITALSQFSGLKVISRDSSFRFRDTKDDSRAIGAKLGVAHLLEGSVSRDADAVRIRAELVNVADGSTQWSHNFDRPYKDLFKLQDEVTGAVAAELKSRLLPEAGAVVQSDAPASGNLEAYEAFKKGNLHKAQDTQAEYELAIVQYREATRLDPRYAQAFAAMAASETAMAAEYLGGDDARKAYASARANATTALALDPKHASTHRALGTIYVWGDLDWQRAEAEYAKAVQLAPSNAGAQIDYASALASVGRVSEAIDRTGKALQSDPYNVFGLSYQAIYLSYVGRGAEAERFARQAIALEPQSLIANWGLTTALVQQGKGLQAREAADRVPEGSMKDWLLAEAELAAGHREAADAALKRLIEKDPDVDAMQIADIYAQRGDATNAFAWLDRAWGNRDPGISFLLYDVFLKPFQGDPRFAAYCRKVGLPPPGAASPHAETSPR